MAVQTDEVREIVDFSPEGFYVTSFYLDVNAAEFPDPDNIVKSMNSLVHQADTDRKEIKADLSHEAAESLRKDLEKIQEFIQNDFQREDTNGVAVFSCSRQEFWQVVQMFTRVENRVVFGPRPYVAPIASFLSHTKPTAILMTDKENARILTMKAGDVREWADIEDWVPQRTSQGGWSQNRYQRRSDNFARHHIDRAAELMLRLLQAYPFDWLILGAEEQYLSTIKNDLHPYLKDRVIGEIHVRIDAPTAEIVEAARQVREEAETRHIDQLIEQIQEYAGAGGRGSIGLKDTLQALNEQKVHIILVQEGYSEPGAECPSCGLLMGSQKETCSACGTETQTVENVVDAAIQRAMELGSIVEVATEIDKLQPIQCIGSIMYY
jgi:peptide chain release factor subunit 1